MKFNSSKIVLIAGVVIIFVVVAYILTGGNTQSHTISPVSDTANSEKKEELKDLGAAPEFLLQDYNGNQVSMADFEGKALILNSWAAWCPFCREELSDFAALQKEFANDIVVVAIDRAESLEKAKGYTDEIGVTNDMVFLLDPDDSFYRSIGGFSMPETLFVDTNGRIRVHKRGFMTREEMRDKTQSLLNI